MVSISSMAKRKVIGKREGLPWKWIGGNVQSDIREKGRL